MKNPLKYKGIRQIALRIIIFVLVLMGTQYLISNFLTTTTFYHNYLEISSKFQLLPFIQRIIFINALIFGFIAFTIRNYRSLKKETIPKFEFSQLSFFLLATSILASHYFLKFMIKSFPSFFDTAPVLWGLIKLAIIGIYATGIAISIFGAKFTVIFAKKYYKSIILFFILTLAFFALMFVVQGFWTLFSGGVAGVLHVVFELLYENVYYKPEYTAFTLSKEGGTTLGVNNFIVGIGKPCSGIDSMLLFISLYLLILIMDWERLNKKKAIILFFLGAVGMYLTNILRIFVLFLVGIHISPKFAVGVFHTNIGWILFILYFFVFWSIGSKWVYNKKKRNLKIKKGKK